MVEEAEEFLNLNQRIQNLETTINQLQFGDEKLSVDIALKYILDLVLEQRQNLIALRLHVRLANIVLSLPGTTEAFKARTGNERVLRSNEWFSGAFRETVSPITVYQEWLANLKTDLADLGLDTMLLENDELPSPPPAFQEPD